LAIAVDSPYLEGARAVRGARERCAMELVGKTVLITGAARGMGRFQAERFAREGARVIATDVDGDSLEGAVDEMKAEGFDLRAYALDVSDRAACFALAAEIGPIDVLVNNAGIVECAEVLDLSERAARRMMEVNYFGMVWMMQAFVPGMVSRRSGHVVNMCSSAAKIGVARLGGYCATKFAALGITDSIRPELKRSGVHFTIVNPGYVNTGMFKGSRVPFITRWQDPRKVAGAIVDAVKKNRAEICVPRFSVRLATFMRGLCLPRFTDIINSVLGGHRSFKTWQRDDSRPF
jgi:NAD(P)-dependent dehydrogenase (short-subunit alcohol dehydrogenase family)